MITYRAMPDVLVELVRSVSGLLQAERRQRGTRRNTRLTTCWKHAVSVPVRFRTKDDIALLRAGSDLSRATAYRHQAEGVQILTDQTPDPTQALAQVEDEGRAYATLDGTVIGTVHDVERPAIGGFDR
jgi:hypothetical protein